MVINSITEKFMQADDEKYKINKLDPSTPVWFPDPSYVGGVREGRVEGSSLLIYHLPAGIFVIEFITIVFTSPRPHRRVWEPTYPPQTSPPSTPTPSVVTLHSSRKLLTIFSTPALPCSTSALCSRFPAHTNPFTFSSSTLP